MADMKISDLPAAPDVNDAQQFEVNDAGNSRSVTFQMLRDKLNTFFDNEYAGIAHTHPVADINDSTNIGRALVTAPSAPAARAAIGAGTSSVELGTTAGTAKAGDWVPNINTDTFGQLPYSRLTGAPSGTPNYLGVGAYIFGATNVGNIHGGNNVAGSSLSGVIIRYFMDESISWSYYAGGPLAGTWKNMSNVKTTTEFGSKTTLFLRVA